MRPSQREDPRDNPRVARRRVQVLADVGLIDCFRPPLLVGTSPKHCVLTALGLQAVSGLDDGSEQPAPRAGDLSRIALRADLKHMVGVNDVFGAENTVRAGGGGFGPFLRSGAVRRFSVCRWRGSAMMAGCAGSVRVSGSDEYVRCVAAAPCAGQ